MLHLIGPGGAGKTTAGAALAERLGASFTDLDAEFARRNRDISAYLETHGYDSYAERNVELYSTLIGASARFGIVALSSGFMTYRDDVHPAYVYWRERIASSNTTFVLVPSLDLETCVAETVLRQLGRPFHRGPEREEQVIRTRLPVYAGLPARKIETMRRVDAIVDDILAIQSSPFAPAHETPVVVTGGRNSATTPAIAASATAPHKDATTPAR
jgi:shikimate kinase